MKSLSEKNESLWLMIVSPALWAAHLMLSYITAAVWCAKFAGPDGTLRPVRWAITAYTALALIGIGMNGWSGLCRHRFGSGRLPHDSDTPEDRRRFLGFATLLLSGLSAISVLFGAIVVFYFEDCR
ncbi:MAG TPA: hypothetical protein VMN36_06730 [Verrucomicrobiales bacterium]|nr:hypothetical protein [Verrucomicrobiales bacterium]